MPRRMPAPQDYAGRLCYILERKFSLRPLLYEALMHDLVGHDQLDLAFHLIQQIEAGDHRQVCILSIIDRLLRKQPPNFAQARFVAQTRAEPEDPVRPFLRIYGVSRDSLDLHRARQAAERLQADDEAYARSYIFIAALSKDVRDYDCVRNSICHIHPGLRADLMSDLARISGCVVDYLFVFDQPEMFRDDVAVKGLLEHLERMNLIGLTAAIALRLPAERSATKQQLRQTWQRLREARRPQRSL